MATSTMFDAVDGLVHVLGDALRTSPGPKPIQVVEGKGVSDTNWREIVFVAGDFVGLAEQEGEPIDVASQQWRTIGADADRDEIYDIGCNLVIAAGEYSRPDGIAVGRRRAGRIMAVVEDTLRDRDAIQLGRPATTPLGAGQILWCEVTSMGMSYLQSAGQVRVAFNIQCRAVV